MNDTIRRALETDLTIDITTTGRKTGLPSRIEIWFFRVGGRIFITGTPGHRNWYANLVADSSIILHFKESVVVEAEATATPITEMEERRAILGEIEPRMRRLTDRAAPFTLDDWLEGSPLAEITFTPANT